MVSLFHYTHQSAVLSLQITKYFFCIMANVIKGFIYVYKIVNTISIHQCMEFFKIILY